MGISVKTAEVHRKNAMRKLVVDNVVKLTHWAITNGLVEAEIASNEANALSVRESELVRLICTGYSTKEAAGLMGIFTSTAETHRNEAMRKLRLNKVAKLTHWAIATGLVKVMTVGAPSRPTSGPDSSALQQLRWS
jgi:DNA-binding NarL/FixJ family response regulator